MPLYSYACPSCGHTFDELRRLNDKTPVFCPKCGMAAEKQMSAANFRVRGFSSSNGYSGGGRR